MTVGELLEHAQEQHQRVIKMLGFELSEHDGWIDVLRMGEDWKTMRNTLEVIVLPGGGPNAARDYEVAVRLCLNSLRLEP